ncbi:VOC family protein [Paraglaciecola sp. L3A3]|uniref:VOC family protein n=1 Tax=Paraglaciecola sp. L3A3 TaxID=2686358 RepID=UPI00131E3685|nr:VOC family protein [Paraglaciecola sp. L3A3]
MAQFISNITLLVDDYDQGIDFYVNKLGFTLLCDVPITPEQRWVRVSPSVTDTSAAIVLAKANPQQAELVGKQAGEGVFLFLQTDNFWHDHQTMQKAGVTFLEEPREEIYATVVVFEDSYGNKWDLLQPKNVG